MKYLIIFLLSLNLCFGEESVVYLEKSKPAPFSGYLLNQERAERFRLLDIESQQQKIIIDNMKDQTRIYEERLEKKDKQLQTMADSLVDSRETGVFSKVGYFILGSVITGLIAYGVYKTK